MSLSQEQRAVPEAPSQRLKMPSTQQFWELLLGDDAVSALSLSEDAEKAPAKEPAQPREARKWGASQEPQSEAEYSTASKHTTFSDGNQLVPPSDLRIDGILQMAGDDLCRQPALLHLQAEKIANAQDELAVQNCSLFLASSKALTSFRCNVENLSATLAEMDQCVRSLRDRLKQFRAESNAATNREAALHILVSMQRLVSELLELPSLVLNCSNGGLYDEAVDVLMLADERLSALRTNGCCNMRLLASMELQLKEARSTCVKSMLRQLGQQAQLAASIKLVGPLRRLSCSEGQLRTQFLQRRDGDIARQRRNVEAACETEPAVGLCAAAELLRLDVLQTAVHYRAIFGTTDGPLSAWVAEQVHWFVKLVKQGLLQGIAGTEALNAPEERSSAFDPVALEAVAAPASRDHESKFRVKLLDLATLFRQAYSAAWALRRVQCFFFPAVAITFDRYVVAVHRQALEGIALAFAQSIDEYDYTPSTLYFSLLEGSPWFQSCLAANPCCVFLLRHAPLSSLYNSIAEVLNSFQECPISTAAPGVVSLLQELVSFCIRKLTSMKPGKPREFQSEIDMIEHSLIQKKEERGASRQQAEFFVMCDVFRCVLLPTLFRHISVILPSGTTLCPQKFRAMMEEAELCSIDSPLAEACTAIGNGPAVPDETPQDTTAFQGVVGSFGNA